MINCVVGNCSPKEIWHGRRIPLDYGSQLWCEQVEKVAIVAVGDHQAALRILAIPFFGGEINLVGNVIGICIACPEKLLAHFLMDGGDESSALRRWFAIVPSFRGVSSEVPQCCDTIMDVLLLSLDGKVLMIDPSVRVRGDVVAFFNTSGNNFWSLFASRADSIQSELHLVVVEKLEKTPLASARAMLELGLSTVAALVDIGLRRVLTERGL